MLLNVAALAALRRWKQQTDDARFVFVKHGKPIQNPRRAWDKLIQSARIEDFRFHDCCHDFASQLVISGVDLLTVSKLLGHSTIEMTMRYAHLSPDHLVNAVNALDS